MDSNFNETPIDMVYKSVDNILKRLTDIATFENVSKNEMSILIQKAMNSNNLSVMDPTWYPWF